MISISRGKLMMDSLNGHCHFSDHQQFQFAQQNKVASFAWLLNRCLHFYLNSILSFLNFGFFICIWDKLYHYYFTRQLLDYTHSQQFKIWKQGRGLKRENKDNTKRQTLQEGKYMVVFARTAFFPSFVCVSEPLVVVYFLLLFNSILSSCSTVGIFSKKCTFCDGQ